VRFGQERECLGGRSLEVPSLECSLAAAACKPVLRQGLPELAAGEVGLPGDRRSLLDLEVVVVRHIAGLEVVPVEMSQHGLSTTFIITSLLCIILMKYCGTRKESHIWVHEHIGRRVAVHIVAEADHIGAVVAGPTEVVVGKAAGRIAVEAAADSTDFEVPGLGMETLDFVMEGRQETEGAGQAVGEEACYIPTALEGMVMKVHHMEQE
jgi:hypothetical protein